MFSWLSCVRLFATPWTAACQTPLSMGFSRQESWSGLPCPSPGDFPDPGIEPGSPVLKEGSLPSEPQSVNFLSFFILFFLSSPLSFFPFFLFLIAFHPSSILSFLPSLYAAGRILFFQPGREPMSPALGGQVLTT